MDHRWQAMAVSPLPRTPPSKRRGGELEVLLQQFASQTSATSATKARREASVTTPTRSAPAQSPFTALYTRRSHSAHMSQTPGSSSFSSTESNAHDGKIELAPPRGAAPTPQSSYLQELKMENRRKERSNTPRRSTRNRKSDILGSDMLPQAATATKLTVAHLPSKPSTARARLRDEIAQKTKTRANNFLAAHKDYFLPLLPEHNHVARLIAQNHPDSIVEYNRLDKQPEGVTATMKSYQLDGLSFLVHLHNNGFSGILGDEMGLGKTLQTLSLFQHLEEEEARTGTVSEELRPYLVVCPLSVLNSWVAEAQKWVPGLEVLRFHGTTNERARLKRVALGMQDQYGNETLLYKNRKATRKAGSKVSKLPTEARSNAFKIVVTTYETFQAEQKWFKHSFVWRYVVLDEGHKIKSSLTQIATALRHIASEYRLILTGTPLQNNMVEMWALLAWLYPDVFTHNTQSLFKESFDLTRGRVNRKTMDDSRRLLELIMLRRMKDSPGVDLGLPPKEEVLLYVPLTPMQRFWYTRLLTRMDDGFLNDLFLDGKSKEKAAMEKDRQDDRLLSQMERLDSPAKSQGQESNWDETAAIMRQTLEKEQAAGRGTSPWLRLMNLILQLRRCCGHPYLVPGAVPDPYYLGQHVIRASGKFILLEKLLKHSIFEQGKKVLVFSGFTQMLDCCEDMLAMLSDFGQDFKYLRLDGSTCRARRNLEIRLFNDPKSIYKVMLLSTKAGGLGINLTSAEDVVFLDEDWNPQITLQAEARAHRIGQTKKVTIYHLLAQGTVEEQMMSRIRKKLYLSAKITESMRSIHGDKASHSIDRPSSLEDDTPAMSTTQLKTLLRRGAQTLSHPEIDANEMLSWDLDTMMQKCCNKPSDPHVNQDAAGTEVDEDKWLSVMERVECAIFDGRRYQRQLKASSAANDILPDSIARQDRRKNKNTTVMIDGFSVSKESTNCADWEAVPTFAGKDPRLADAIREKRRDIQHEEHCLACFDEPSSGHMVECKSCPRSYHFDCLEPQYQAKVKGFSGFFCSQHTCHKCDKNTTDAGGLIYRCRWCPQGFCEDCLAWGKEELISENLPEFEMLGETPAGGFYIKCPDCVEAGESDEDRHNWMVAMEESYKQQHEIWLVEQQQEQQRVEKEQDAAHEAQLRPVKTVELRLDTLGSEQLQPIVIDDDSDGPSPPALTDTSFATPALDASGISTPRTQPPGLTIGKRRPVNMEDAFDSVRGKRARNAEDPVILEFHDRES